MMCWTGTCAALVTCSHFVTYPMLMTHQKLKPILNGFAQKLDKGEAPSGDQGLDLDLLAVCATMYPGGNPTFLAAVCGFLTGAMFFFFPLLLLAKITALCIGPGTQHKAVLTAARRYPVTGFAKDNHGKDVLNISPEEKLAHERFMNFCLQAPLGSELFGFRITMPLVIGSATKHLTYLPVLGAVLQKDHIFVNYHKNHTAVH